MNTISLTNLEKIATAFRWIVENHYPTTPKQKPHHIRMVVGPDKVEEAECAVNENVVSLSSNGIKFWFRPYSEPGAPPFSHVKITGLFDFMRTVIWPRVTGEWATDRLMLESRLSDLEREAVEEHQRLKAEDKALNLKDIDSLLMSQPDLARLYAATQCADAEQLQLLSESLPGNVAEIGNKPIRELAEAFTSGDEVRITAGKRHMIFLILNIAGRSLMAAGKFDWHSPEFHENGRRTQEQGKLLGRLARHRYACEFETFCCSAEMLEIVRDISVPGTEDVAIAYASEVSAFVQSKLASTDFSA